MRLDPRATFKSKGVLPADVSDDALATRERGLNDDTSVTYRDVKRVEIVALTAPSARYMLTKR